MLHTVVPCSNEIYGKRPAKNMYGKEGLKLVNLQVNAEGFNIQTTING